MHIYIDESGAFSCPRQQGNYVSCVAALTIPDSDHDTLIEHFESMINPWGFANTEVKGRDLDEEQIADCLVLLSRYNVIISIAAIDIGLHTDRLITDHKEGQANRMVDGLGPEYHPNLVNQVQQLADRLQSLSNPLYAQSALLTQLGVSVVQTGTLYYSQTDPQTLSRFAWRVDAKAERITEYEDLWSVIILPFAQSASLRDPLVFLDAGNYSDFARFERPDLPSAPDHLRDVVANPDETFSSFDVKRVMSEDLGFFDSRDRRGLQLADIAANCFQRACNGRLRPPGYLPLGRLLMVDPRFDNALRLLTLSQFVASSNPTESMPYSHVIAQLETQARSCIAEPE